MLKALKEAVKPFVYRRAMRRAAAQLRALGGEFNLRVAEGLDLAGRGWMDAGERAWADRVEALRRKVYAASGDIALPDFGAGYDGGASGGAGRTISRNLGDFARGGSSPPVWAVMHLRMVRALRPEACLELGTCVGISCAYQAAGLRLNGAGRIYTHEGAPAVAEVARGHFAALGLDNVEVVVGPFQRTLAATLEKAPPPAYVFIDGHHDEQATWDYFNQVEPFLADEAVVVFDDIAWSAGMKRVWRRLAADPRMAAAFDLRHLGLCVCRREGAPSK